MFGPGSGEPCSGAAGDGRRGAEGGEGRRGLQGARRHQRRRRGVGGGRGGDPGGRVRAAGSPSPRRRPATVGAQFTPANLEQYRAVVFLDTGLASPLTDAQRDELRGLLPEGGGFVGIGSAIETDASWPFLTNILGTRSSGRTAAQSATVKVFDRVHDATQEPAAVLGPHRPLLQLLDQRPRRLARARRRSSRTRSARSRRATPRRHRRRHDGRRPPDLVVQGLPGRPLVLHRRSAPPRRPSTPSCTTHLKGAHRLGRGPERPDLQRLRRDRARNYQQTKITAQPNLNEPIGFDQLPDGRIIQTARRGGVRLHNPATGTTQVIADFGAASAAADAARVHELRGRPVRPGDRQRLRHQQVGVPLLLAADGHRRQALRRLDRHADHAEHGAPELRAVGQRRGIRTSATSSSAASSSSRTRAAPRLDLASEQQILRVSNNRQECCHVAGDIDFDKHGNLWLVTGDDTPAGGINADGFGPFNDQLTDEQQTVRTTNATGGTFTLTFNGQTTAPLAVQRHRGAGRRRARGAVERRRQRHPDQRRPGRSTATSTSSSGAR